MDNSIIYGYFRLGKKIEQVKNRYTYYEWLFWQQSFTGCPNAYDDNGNELRAMPFQKQVNELVSYEDLNDTIIELLEFKQREFERFLASLSNDDVTYLKTKFMMHIKLDSNLELEQDAINECNQIEEASGYRFGFKNDEAVDLTNDYETNFNNILSMLG